MQCSTFCEAWETALPKERGRIQHKALEPTTRRLRALRSAAFCHKQQHTRNAFPPFTNLVSAKARRGFELRLPDSESGVLTVTPLGQMPLSGKQGRGQCWDAPFSFTGEVKQQGGPCASHPSKSVLLSLSLLSKQRHLARWCNGQHSRL